MGPEPGGALGSRKQNKMRLDLQGLSGKGEIDPSSGV